MSEAPPRLPASARLQIRIRLKIAFLKLLLRFINSRAGKATLRFLLRPILRVWLYTFLGRVLFDHRPVALIAADPKAADILAQLEETRNRPIQSDITERQYNELQATTWGTAGIAMVIEVAIATSSKPLGTGMSVAAACFAVVMPLLILFGFIQAHHYNPKKDRPTPAKEMMSLMAMIYGAQFLFCVGLTAMLYDFNRIVAVAFLCGCWLALRILRKFSLKIVAAQASPKVSAMTEKPLPPEPDPPKTNEEEMQRMLKDNARLSGAVVPTEPPEDPSGDGTK